MDWTTLSTKEQLLEFEKEGGLFLIFKHSTRCSISAVAKDRLERISKEGLPILYLDLIRFRELSNFIAEYYQVEHQSPQVIFIKNKKAMGDLTHMAISSSSVDRAIGVA